MGDLNDPMKADQYNIYNIAEGMYFFTASVTGPDGNTYQDTISIAAMDRAQLDSLLRNKWEGIKAAIISGNVEAALTYFVSGAQDSYRAIFTNPSRNIVARLSEITGIEIYSVEGRVAQCGAIRPEATGEYAYPLTFVIDENGIWRILGF